MNKAEIAEVYPGTIADRLGLAPGDCILAVNGVKPLDMIQFQWEWAGEEVSLEVSGKGGTRLHRIEKAYDEGLGVRFEQPVFDGIRRCGNRCLFCFVDQTPPGCRESLYIKDDDYRLSFLQGSFVTLTNADEADLRRIESERLSPLYVSVHAVDRDVRARLLGLPKPDRLMEILKRLSGAGIEFHFQVVLCPGINDGEILQRTVDALGALDGALSLAIVPVGLTGHREGLAGLCPVSGMEAGELIRRIGPMQEKYLVEKGTRFVWLSDEFYVLAGADLPPGESYEGFPQWENGVGLVRGLLDEAEEYALPASLDQERRLTLAGGTSGMKALAPLWERLRQVKGLALELLPIENRFFGQSVTVSGLLTGKCLIEGLQSKGLPKGTAVYLPETMLRADGKLFLDGMRPDEASENLGLRLVFLPQNGKELLAKLMEDLEAIP